MISFFVTGTDTGVGKTRISVALIELLQQHDHRVAGMKPIASGCELTSQGLRNDDALQLIRQANVTFPYETVNPYAFKAAIAPHIAAHNDNINIDLSTIKQAFNQIKQQCDSVVVEGAGGWLVPLNDQQSMADLAVELALPVILVVDIRLGCINHALLTVATIQTTGLKLHGWVANTRQNTPQAEAIISSLKQRIAEPCLGIVPKLNEHDSAVDYLKL